jgi:hypothetical protein
MSEDDDGSVAPDKKIHVEEEQLDGNMDDTRTRTEMPTFGSIRG